MPGGTLTPRIRTERGEDAVALGEALERGALRIPLGRGVAVDVLFGRSAAMCVMVEIDRSHRPDFVETLDSILTDGTPPTQVLNSWEFFQLDQLPATYEPTNAAVVQVSVLNQDGTPAPDHPTRRLRRLAVLSTMYLWPGRGKRSRLLFDLVGHHSELVGLVRCAGLCIALQPIPEALRGPGAAWDAAAAHGVDHSNLSMRLPGELVTQLGSFLATSDLALRPDERGALGQQMIDGGGYDYTGLSLGGARPPGVPGGITSLN